MIILCATTLLGFCRKLVKRRGLILHLMGLIVHCGSGEIFSQADIYFPHCHLPRLIHPLLQKSAQRTKKFKKRLSLFKFFTFHFVQSQVAVLEARVWANLYWTNQSPNSACSWNWQIISEPSGKINPTDDCDWANCSPVDYKKGLDWFREGEDHLLPSEKNSGLLFLVQNMKWGFELNIARL